MGKFRDLTGQKFGKLTVAALSQEDGRKRKWKCICDCGNETVVIGENLVYGHTKSCGCLLNLYKDMSSKKFGRLTPIRISGKDGSAITWLCKCDCGNTTIVRGSSLTNGHSKSCGCLSREKTSKKFLKDIAGKKFGKWFVIRKSETVNDIIYWECRCDCGNIRKVNGESLRRGASLSCGCKRAEDLTGQIFGNRLFLKMSDRKSGEKIRWDCQCLICGNIRSVTPGNVKFGKSFSCGCVKSKAEFMMSTLLKENSVKFDSQKKFKGCVYKSILFFDFYIPHLNMCIELDGEQHDFPVEFFGGEKCFIETQLRDQIKNTYCLEHNINLLRIPYTQFHRLEEICKENKII